MSENAGGPGSRLSGWRASFPTAILAAALFVPQVAGGIYRGLGREPPQEMLLLGPGALFLSLAAWFWSYCRAHQIEWLMDMGWFLMIGWPVVLPYYLIKHEGRRGLARVGLFLLTYFAAWAFGWATAIWTQLLSSTE